MFFNLPIFTVCLFDQDQSPCTRQLALVIFVKSPLKKYKKVAFVYHDVQALVETTHRCLDLAYNLSLVDP